MAGLTPDQAELARAQAILARRPRLAGVVIAVDEMTAGRRTCRVSIDVSSGVIRVFREVLERQVPLTPDAPTGPGG